MQKANWFNTRYLSFKKDFKTTVSALIYFALSGLFFWLLLQLLYHFYEFSLIQYVYELPFIKNSFGYFYTNITQLTDVGIIYTFLFSSLFFLPVPLEILFIKFIHDSINNILILTILGIFIGQLINYTIGRIFNFVLVFFKPKTKKNFKQKLDEYGSFFVLVAHIIPFPFQLFNVVLGAMRFNFLKFILYSLIGLTIKHGIIYIFLK